MAMAAPQNPTGAPSARRELAAALELGIEREDLLALYQPVVALSSGRPTHMEALVRWNRPGVQLLTPDKFLRIAEETGIIDRLGRWMLNRAVRDCAAWQEHAPGVGVSVNVSPRQFDKGDFVDLVDSVVRDVGLAPELLTIEISERAMSEWRQPVLGVLREIRALGVGMSLDDVGVSDVSLRVLSALPLTELKIDTSLIATLADAGGESRLIGLVLEIARSLGLSAVAEGIDSATKLQAVQQLGCCYGQGLFFAEPARFSSIVRELVRQMPARPRSAPS
jgi:diguanylate cyclase